MMSCWKQNSVPRLVLIKKKCVLNKTLQTQYLESVNFF